MGIPSLFRYMKTKYPLIIVDNKKIKTDCLHIDFNALIHISTHPEDGVVNNQNEMFQLLGHNINRLVKELKPKKSLILATDGVAPRAKLNQQRARRFSAAQEAMRSGDFDAESSFDINCLTPGTIFMEELRNFVIEFISYKQSTDENFKDLEIIYSDDTVPGEGEHKILDYIKSMDESLNHAIFSPDADFLFLSLTLHQYNIHMIREDLDFIGTFRKEVCCLCNKRGHTADFCGKLRLEKIIAVSIKKLRTYLKQEFDVIGKPYQLNNMINDLILICFLAGNDFLPTLPCLDVRFEAVEFLTSIMLNMFNGVYITDDKGINFNRLNVYFTKLAEIEDELYAKKSNELASVRAKIFPNRTFEEIDLTSPFGKKVYYEKKLYVRDDQQKNDICYSYLKTLAWNFDYYMGKANNWDQFYPQHYAPLASDLAKLKNVQCFFNRTHPICPFRQLLLVLPGRSKHLVPPCFRSIFENEKMYPTRIRIDRFDKLWDWQAVVRIPLISAKKVYQFFDDNKNKLTTEENMRNIRGRDMIFLSKNNKQIKNIDLTSTNPVDYKNTYSFQIIPSFLGSTEKMELKSSEISFVNKSVVFTIKENEEIFEPKWQVLKRKKY